MTGASAIVILSALNWLHTAAPTIALLILVFTAISEAISSLGQAILKSPITLASVIKADW